VIVDGVMYVMGTDNAIVALDAATGRQIWAHPDERTPTDCGINYWESKDRSDRRLIFAANSYLQEINLRSGVTIASFSKDGRVDLREGLGRDPKTIRNIQTGTTGRVFENLIIVGSALGEGYGSPPGDLRAYDYECSVVSWCGRFTRFRIPASRGTTRGPKTRGRTSAAANGARLRSMRSAALRHFCWVRPRTIFTARTASARPVRQLPAGARRSYRQTPVAFSGCPSRPLGLRPGDTSHAADGAASRWTLWCR
jgi:hypothetical protein